MKKLLLPFAFVILGLLSACDPNDDASNPSTPSQFEENFGSLVSRDFIGQIVTVYNEPIANATVKVGNLSVQTDASGVFIINGASVYEKFAYVTATKTGYVDGSRSLVPTTGKNNVKIMLLEAGASETVQSGQASEVSIYSGTKVNFDGSFEDENGNAYSGPVDVFMFHLTASNQDIAALMPGMLYAETQSGNEAVLQTFGMLNVELRGSGGQKLQIAEGHTAQITMRIDDEQLATAPQTIPLWHFDDEKGWWKEDGTATRQGNYYVGNVSHFSWWNCDTFASTVNLTVTVHDASGNPVSNAGVKLETSWGFTSYTNYTNLDGQISGLVPAGDSMTLTLLDACGGIVSTQVIGPFNSDTNLPALTLNSSTSLTEITGTLLQCNGNPVTNGYVWFSNGSSYPTMGSVATDGTFSFSTLLCNPDATFTLKGVDYGNLQVTDSVTYTYQQPVTNIGTLSACNNVEEFISYQIDNQAPVIIIDGLNAGIVQEYLNVGGYTPDEQNGLYIFGPTQVAGTFTTADGFGLEGNGIVVNNSTPNTLQFVISNLGNVGEFIDITVNGTYNDGTTTRTLSYTAHVIRQY